jgi:hypothetical protein
LVLRPSVPAWGSVLVGGLAGVVAGMALAANPANAVALFGGIALLLAGVVALSMGAVMLAAPKYHLRLDEFGFDVGGRRREWNQVELFRLATVGRRRRVGILLVPSAREGAAKAGGRVAYDVLLPRTYGLTAPKLAALLEQWRLRASPTRLSDL